MILSIIQIIVPILFFFFLVGIKPSFAFMVSILSSTFFVAGICLLKKKLYLSAESLVFFESKPWPIH